MDTVQGLLGCALLICFVGATIAAISAGVIWIKRRAARILVRAAERRAFAHRWRGVAMPTRDDEGSFFPVATTVSFLVIALLAVGAPLVSFWLTEASRDLGAGKIVLLASAFGPALALFALPVILYLHFSEVVGRRTKYEMVLTCALTCWFCNAAMVPAILHFDRGWNLATSIGLAVGLLFWWVLFVVAQLAIPRLVARGAERELFSKWFYLLRSQIWWILSWFIMPVFVLYCVVRFFLVRVAARHPILYFRTFRLGTPDVAFGEIVARAARRFGVVEGLVVGSQLASDLQPSLDLVDQGRFVAADDAHWREWVMTKLSHASLVIIDMTDATVNVDWEVMQSISTLGARRVAIIYTGAPPTGCEDVWRLQYNFGRQGIRSARRELSRWMKGVVLPSGSA